MKTKLFQKSGFSFIASALLLVLSVNINAQVDSIKVALNYYPLHIGDYWQYNITKDPSNEWNLFKTWTGYKEVIGDTIMSNNKRYYKMKVVSIKTQENPNYLNLAFIRIDSSTALIYQYEGGSNDQVIDNLFVKKGVFIPGVGFCQDISSKSYFGLPSITTISFKSLEMEDESDNWDLAYGLGDVMRSYYIADPYAVDYQNNLTYAKINNIEYGTKVGVAISEKLPTQAVLFQNYPNPFNPTTTIKYFVLKSGFVTIKLYDVLGCEVTTLVNENKPVGNYSIKFNAAKLVSGVYLCRMQADDFVQTKKLILLK